MYYEDMLHFLLDFFFPKRSLLNIEGEWITRDERAMLRSYPVILTGGALTERGIRSLDRIVAASRYSSTPLLRKAIHSFKYRKVFDLARDLSALMLQAVPKLDLHPEPVLCPVPLHWTRRFERGFNQAELLAIELSQVLDYPVKNLLTRVRPTGHQAWRLRNDRQKALNGAFQFEGSFVPEFVILIDDLSTTGATLETCARELKIAGVKRVEGWVVAQG